MKRTDCNKTGLPEQNKPPRKRSSNIQKEAQTAQKEAQTAQKEAETASETAAANPMDIPAQQAAAVKQAEAQQKQQLAQQKLTEAGAQQTAAENQQKKADEAQNTAAVQQAKADKKLTEAQTERTDIAKDQQQIADEAAQNTDAPSVYGLRLTDDKKLLSGMVKINVLTGKTIAESPVTVIRNRTLCTAGNNYMAVAGETGGNATVKLVLLDSKNMEIIKESSEVVAENSVLVQDGTDYYCIIQDGTKWVVGKYDSTLLLRLKSPVAVKSSTPVSVNKAGICVTAADGSAVLLKLDDLTTIPVKK